MKPEEVCMGTQVRVSERHRIEERRGKVGKVVGRYGGDGYVAVEVRFADRHSRLFWPADLEEVNAARPLWRSLLGRRRAQ